MSYTKFKKISKTFLQEQVFKKIRYIRIWRKFDVKVGKVNFDLARYAKG